MLEAFKRKKDDKPAIRVDNVSKTFNVRTVREAGGGGAVLSGGMEKRRALRNVSFTVGKGQTVGIIGHNGAGKPTLLKVITGIHEADSGSVHIDGTVTPIIGLAAGFSPQLSGIENIYLKGAAMGMSEKEVDARMDEILEFSEVGHALGRPLRTYSSGMMMRLAFSIAFLRTPEVLIVDETLMVGDETFRRKSLSRIQEIKASGATILLVSHGGAMLKNFCDRLLLMDNGELLLNSDPEDTLEAYYRLVYAAPEDQPAIREQIRKQGHGQVAVPSRENAGPDSAGQSGSAPEGEVTPVQRIQSRGGMIQGLRLADAEDRTVRHVTSGEALKLQSPVLFTEPTRDVSLRVNVSTSEGLELGALYLEPRELEENFVKARQKVDFEGVMRFGLAPGTYFLGVELFGHVGKDHYCLHSMGQMKAVQVTGGEQPDRVEGPVDFAGSFQVS